MPWLIAVGVCFYGARWLPDYKHVLEGLGFLGGGPLIAYLAIALPPGTLATANVSRPPFRRIPHLGKYGRQLFFALGICLALLGVAMLAGWV